MVGKRRSRDTDHKAQAVWQDPEYEHAGEILFREICRPQRSVRGALHLERGKVPAAAGDLSGSFYQLCGCEGNLLSPDPEKDLRHHPATL